MTRFLNWLTVRLLARQANHAYAAQLLAATDRDNRLARSAEIRREIRQRRAALLVPAATVAVVIGFSVPAFADYWKAGVRDTHYETRQAVNGTWCTKLPGTGYSQCRWKNDNGCRWFADGSGSNQCTPGTPAPAPVTFAATNGSLTITDEEDGDSDPDTKQATVRARYTSTDDEVTFRVRVRVTGGYTVTRLSSSIRGVAYTDLKQLGTSIYRNASGWQANHAPPAPPLVLPGGATCAVAWATYQATQLNCYTGSVANNFVSGLQNGLWNAGGITLGCAFKGMSGVVACAADPVKGILIVDMLRGLFSSAYSGAACNSMAQATKSMNSQCFH